MSAESFYAHFISPRDWSSATNAVKLATLNAKIGELLPTQPPAKQDTVDDEAFVELLATIVRLCVDLKCHSLFAFIIKNVRSKLLGAEFLFDIFSAYLSAAFIGDDDPELLPFFDVISPIVQLRLHDAMYVRNKEIRDPETHAVITDTHSVTIGHFFGIIFTRPYLLDKFIFDYIEQVSKINSAAKRVIPTKVMNAVFRYVLRVIGEPDRIISVPPAKPPIFIHSEVLRKCYFHLTEKVDRHEFQSFNVNFLKRLIVLPIEQLASGKNKFDVLSCYQYLSEVASTRRHLEKRTKGYFLEQRPSERPVKESDKMEVTEQVEKKACEDETNSSDANKAADNDGDDATSKEEKCDVSVKTDKSDSTEKDPLCFFFDDKLKMDYMEKFLVPQLFGCAKALVQATVNDVDFRKVLRELCAETCHFVGLFPIDRIVATLTTLQSVTFTYCRNPSGRLTKAVKEGIMTQVRSIFASILVNIVIDMFQTRQLRAKSGAACRDEATALGEVITLIIDDVLAKEQCDMYTTEPFDSWYFDVRGPSSRDEAKKDKDKDAVATPINYSRTVFAFIEVLHHMKKWPAAWFCLLNNYNFCSYISLDEVCVGRREITDEKYNIKVRFIAAYLQEKFGEAMKAYENKDAKADKLMSEALEQYLQVVKHFDQELADRRRPRTSVIAEVQLSKWFDKFYAISKKSADAKLTNRLLEILDYWPVFQCDPISAEPYEDKIINCFATSKNILDPTVMKCYQKAVESQSFEMQPTKHVGLLLDCTKHSRHVGVLAAVCRSFMSTYFIQSYESLEQKISVDRERRLRRQREADAKKLQEEKEREAKAEQEKKDRSVDGSNEEGDKKTQGDDQTENKAEKASEATSSTTAITESVPSEMIGMEESDRSYMFSDLFFTLRINRTDDIDHPVPPSTNNERTESSKDRDESEEKAGKTENGDTLPVSLENGDVKKPPSLSLRYVLEVMQQLAKTNNANLEQQSAVTNATKPPAMTSIDEFFKFLMGVALTTNISVPLDSGNIKDDDCVASKFKQICDSCPLKFTSQRIERQSSNKSIVYEFVIQRDTLSQYFIDVLKSQTTTSTSNPDLSNVWWNVYQFPAESRHAAKSIPAMKVMISTFKASSRSSGRGSGREPSKSKDDVRGKDDVGARSSTPSKRPRYDSRYATHDRQPHFPSHTAAEPDHYRDRGRHRDSRDRVPDVVPSSTKRVTPPREERRDYRARDYREPPAVSRKYPDEPHRDAGRDRYDAGDRYGQSSRKRTAEFDSGHDTSRRDYDASGYNGRQEGRHDIDSSDRYHAPDVDKHHSSSYQYKSGSYAGNNNNSSSYAGATSYTGHDRTDSDYYAKQRKRERSDQYDDTRAPATSDPSSYSYYSTTYPQIAYSANTAQPPSQSKAPVAAAAAPAVKPSSGPATSVYSHLEPSSHHTQPSAYQPSTAQTAVAGVHAATVQPIRQPPMASQQPVPAAAPSYPHAPVNNAVGHGWVPPNQTQHVQPQQSNSSYSYTTQPAAAPGLAKPSTNFSYGVPQGATSGQQPQQHQAYQTYAAGAAASQGQSTFPYPASAVGTAAAQPTPGGTQVPFAHGQASAYTASPSAQPRHAQYQATDVNAYHPR